ncbi:hypothetical protein J6590_080492, partial [Homalodisca vitripennis]
MIKVKLTVLKKNSLGETGADELVVTKLIKPTTRVRPYRDDVSYGGLDLLSAYKYIEEEIPLVICSVVQFLN